MGVQKGFRRSFTGTIDVLKMIQKDLKKQKKFLYAYYRGTGKFMGLSNLQRSSMGFIEF